MYVGSVPEVASPIAVSTHSLEMRNKENRVVMFNKHKYVLPKLSGNYCNFKMGTVVLWESEN